MTRGEELLRGWLRKCGYEWADELYAAADLVDEAFTTGRTREATRKLHNHLRALGIRINLESAIRTEGAIVACRSAWNARGWNGDALIYRLTSPNACRHCLRLYRLSNGMPRVYFAGDVDVPGALRPNRGKRSQWKPKIGPCHVSCVCPPWLRWHPAMEGLLARRAPEYAAIMRRLGIL